MTCGTVERYLNMGSAGDEIRITFLQVEDWREWRALRLAALADAPNAFSSRLEDWSGPADREDRWRNRLASIPFNAVATVNGIPAGMVGATAPSEGESELLSMWVAPAVRGKGVADALVEAVVDWARRQGAARLALDVREANAHAIALYGRHGFQDVGPAPTSAGAPPERRMSRSLA